MEKQKRWQFYVIVGVILLTIYNILPTVFYYSKPLSQPITEKRAQKITTEIAARINSLEKEHKDWLHSFCSALHIKSQAIRLDPKTPQWIHISFAREEDAQKFRKFLPRAGELISFVPSQLSLAESSLADPKVVVVQRKIPVHFEKAELPSTFQFSSKVNTQGQLTELYKALINDRALQLGVAVGGPSENAQLLQGALSSPLSADASSEDITIHLAENILSFTKTFGEAHPATQRFYASFTQSENRAGSDLIQRFVSTMQQLREKFRLQRTAFVQESEKAQREGTYFDPVKQQQLNALNYKEKILIEAEAILVRNQQTFASGSTPWTFASFGTQLQQNLQTLPSGAHIQTLSMEGKHPFIESIAIDWHNETLSLNLHTDVAGLKKKMESSRSTKGQLDQIDQWIFNSIAWISREAREIIEPSQGRFQIVLNSLTHSKSFVAMRLSAIAKAQIEQITETLYNQWNPQHPDLQKGAFPIWDYETYQNLPVEEKKLGLIIYAPSVSGKAPTRGFKMNSVYVVAKGLDMIMQRVRANPNAPLSQQFIKDFSELRNILQNQGLFGYAASLQFFSKEYSGDFIFEKEDYYLSVLKASRENFTVHGTQRYAVLEFTDVQQRILAENRIDDSMHEDLLRWRDDHRAAQMHLRGSSPFDVPKPTRSVFWDNLRLSFIKYFRGDDRKIVHWGLDLSGGKTVQIELRDTDNRLVSNEADIRQGINELYKRVNAMGVSEVSIRQEGNYITLDFPGSQGVSASDLVKASSMFFHVVNEKFSRSNPAIAEAVHRFLQEVWNEAVVTNRKEGEDINAIAFRHLYGDSMDTAHAQPRSEAAKILIENGLILANPLDTTSSTFNDSISKIAVFRGSDFTDWQGQTHPLLIVFKNYVLEGSSLENIHASYDPSKGNFLSFSVKGSHTRSHGQKFDPREDFHLWTSHFSKEKISGTSLAQYSQGKGWRMAVILNGSVISAPTLDAALRDSAMISGGFTQREVNQLEADLKAGSLTFTPRILSEKNLSPELGAKEKNLGILATAIAMVLVVAAMAFYYRFGGIVASVALIFNLLIMWATLQNLQATLTLASIAGLILTLGMAVDANVLVFERIREEFATTGKIANALHAGYKKAFSAILDSNLTTIIAALILLNFDSGPIKFFAITLIIGIISSMFTALFMTRYYFAGWVQNPENKILKMANWFKSGNINFLKYTKMTLILTTIVIVGGLAILGAQRKSILGMDFTGGYALTLELKTMPDAHYRERVEKAFLKKGASAQDFQIRELTPANTLRIFFSRSMDQQGRAFFNMPMQSAVKEVRYAFENNPRLLWIVQALQEQGLSPTSEGLKNLDSNWTVVSGQISSAMRNNAFIGLSLALLCILIYITVRFEFKYAISATLCLAHDVIFTIGVIAVLHALKVPVQIDLNTVAALMTIIGYSLNDTIIVFDRVRENVKAMRKTDFATIINHSLNATLGRTVMTSGTTLLVLIPLILLGGSTIFGFALVMSVGVIFGTLSSLFIAAPLMQFFHKREKGRENSAVIVQQ